LRHLGEGRRLAWGKESASGTWEGGRPLNNLGGHVARNLLGGGGFPNFVFTLAARARARGNLAVGGAGRIVQVEVACGEGGHVIPASSERTGFVGVEEQLGILLEVPASLA